MRLRLPACHNSLTNSSFRASPARLTVTTPSGSRPCSISFAMAEGTVFSNRARLGIFPSRRLSHQPSTSSTSTTVPPQVRVAHSSKMERSKQTEVEASTPISVRNFSFPQAFPPAEHVVNQHDCSATSQGRPQFKNGKIETDRGRGQHSDLG